mgnify:CR=1 FL=1
MTPKRPAGARTTPAPATTPDPFQKTTWSYSPSAQSNTDAAPAPPEILGVAAMGGTIASDGNVAGMGNGVGEQRKGYSPAYASQLSYMLTPETSEDLGNVGKILLRPKQTKFGWRSLTSTIRGTILPGRYGTDSRHMHRAGFEGGADRKFLSADVLSGLKDEETQLVDMLGDRGGPARGAMGWTMAKSLMSVFYTVTKQGLSYEHQSYYSSAATKFAHLGTALEENSFALALLGSVENLSKTEFPKVRKVIDGAQAMWPYLRMGIHIYAAASLSLIHI